MPIRAACVVTVVGLVILCPCRFAAARAQDDQTAARVDLLLQNAQRYARASEWRQAVDALEEARRLAGDPKPGGFGSDPLAERVTSEALGLRGVLSRAATPLVGSMTQAIGSLDATRKALEGLTSVIEAVSAGTPAPLSKSSTAFGIDRAEARLKETLAYFRLSDPQPTVDEVRRLADAVCRATDPLRAADDWDVLDNRMRPLEQVADRAMVWDGMRAGVDPEYRELSRATLSKLGDELTGLERFGGGPATGEGLDVLRRQVAAAASAMRSAAGQVAQAQARLEPMIDAYMRLRTLVRVGEEGDSAVWMGKSGEAARALEEDRRQVESVEARLARLSAPDGKALAASFHGAVGEQRKRFAEVERVVLAADKLASDVLATRMVARREAQRATSCREALWSRAAAQARTRLQAPPPTANTPAQSSSGGSGSPGGQPPSTPQPPVPAPAAPSTTQTAPPPVRPQQPPPPAAAPAPPPPVDPNTAGGIRIQGGATRLAVGQRAQFVATDYGNRPYTNVTWNSLREDLLAVDGQGRATGLSPGRLTLQAKYGEDMLATIEVEVVAAGTASPGAPATGAAGTASPGTPATGAAGGVSPGAQTTGAAGAGGGFRDLGGTTAPDLRATPPTGGQPDAARPSETRGFTDYGGTTTPAPSAGAAGSEVGRESVRLLGQAAPQDLWHEAGATAATRPGDPPGQGATPTRPGGPPGRGTTPAPPGPTDPSAFVMNASRFGQTPLGGAQPAAWHIFATGSRLGWAAGLGQYSVGPADASITEHLRAAGEHAMWANRQSFAPTLAWTGWQNMRATYRGWADVLQRTPTNDVRRRIAADSAGQISGLAQVLNYQTVGTTEPRDNCDAAYVRLGFHLGYGAQVMQMADEAVRSGDRRGSVAPRQDAMSHLRTAASILIDYERVIVASGRCADLREVRALVERVFAINANEVASQAATATSAWELANRLIAALAGAAPRGMQRAQSGPAPAPAPPPRPAPPALPPTPPAASPREALLADPGELEGYWAGFGQDPGQRYILRFSRQGNEYVGVFEEAFGKQFGHSDGEVVFRGRRVGPNAYEGTFQVRKLFQWPAAGRLEYVAGSQIETVGIAVVGATLRLQGPSRPNPYQATLLYTLADLVCMRVLGPSPWAMPDGNPIDAARDAPNSLTMSTPMWYLARGKNATGADAFIVYPDGATGRQGQRKDALSEAWLQRGFVVVEGPTYFSLCVGKVARFPGAQR